MSFFGTTDFLIEVSKGNISGHSLVNVYGHNPDLDAALSDIWSADIIRVWLQAASILEVLSSSALDTAAGTNARQVFIDGLDSSFNEISEFVALNGVTPVATVNSYIRINSMTVTQSGTYGGTTTGANAGTITLRVTGGGATQATIEVDTVGYGVATQSHYTIPAGKTGFILNFKVSVKSPDQASIYMFQRRNADDVTVPVNPHRLLFNMEWISGTNSFKIDAPVRLPEKTDLWVAGIGSAANTVTSVEYDLLLVDN